VDLLEVAKVGMVGHRLDQKARMEQYLVEAVVMHSPLPRLLPKVLEGMVK
jgi:hypothetical protein